MKKFYLILPALLVSATVSLLSQDLSKKMVLKNLESKDETSSSITEKVNTALKSKLIEVSGDKFQILDLDDIRSMPGKEKFGEKKGVTADVVKEVASAVNAVEVIAGTVGREGDRIRISIQSFGANGVSKSSVNELFTDTEILDDYYLGEIVKKLGNAKYAVKRIDISGAKEISNMQKFQPGAGVSEKIAVINFNSTDDTVAKLVNILQKDLDEGDNQYKSADYEGAVKTYGAIAKKISEKLTKEKQALMKNYAESINARISSSYAMFLKTALKALDDQLEAAKNNPSSSTDSLVDAGSELLKAFNAIPADYRVKFAQFKDVLSNRTDVIYSIGIQRLETEANEAYRQMDFENALRKYEKARDSVKKIGDKNLSAKISQRISKKIDTTNISGKNYLGNRTKLMLDEIEELNLQDKSEQAREKLKFAAELIVGSNFKYEALYKKYNDVSDLVKGSRISAKTKPSDLQQKALNKKGIVKTNGSGLVLRTGPSATASKLMVIPDNSEISVLVETDKTETILGKQGKWLKVSYNNITGYAFGGFVQY